MQTVSEIWIGGVVFGWLTIRGEMGFYYNMLLGEVGERGKIRPPGKDEERRGADGAAGPMSLPR